MKKIILVTCLLLTTGIGAMAQLPSFAFGIKAGLNVSKLKSDVAAEENRTGYQAGVFARFGGAGLYFQPELYLGSKGSTYPTAAQVYSGDEKINFTTLDLPLLIGTKIGPGGLNVRFMAGPVVSFLLDNEEPESTASQDVKDFRNYKDQALGLQAGAGIDISKLTFDVRYEAGISNINKTDKYDQKTNLWHLSLGYKIF
ncbi:porin family protein [Daejeonella sp.]|uniref:porin family protein n=1 Tax=Daejeonella sp. TaxID=2805397 RepID=UPI0030BE98B9